LIDFKLYVIIDRKSCGGRDPVCVAEEAIAGGADIIQLRDKDSTACEILEAGRAIRGLAKKNKALFIINDRVDIALALDADGVHLGQDDLPIESARSMIGREKLIGLSTHSLSQALDAQKRGADYIGVGPIFSTPTKPDYKAVGIDSIREVRDNIKIPFVVIGGIDRSNIDEVIAAGAGRVAVVRAVCGAEDVRGAAKRLKERLKDI
jgi:thiamine-phosphate pyrophosphorylase